MSKENIFPVKLIKDENKRKEFISEYKRLLPRIGRGAMEKNFILYMNEK